MGRKVNFILQGKGGVGKSFVAALLAQHYRANDGGNVVCVDTDPVNATFSGYAAFHTRRVELLDNGVVDSGRFDALMMSIVEEDADFIVDNGASCFIPLTKYLFESDALGVIGGTGRQVCAYRPCRSAIPAEADHPFRPRRSPALTPLGRSTSPASGTWSSCRSPS